MSEALGNLVLRECRAANFSDCDLVFSGLNSDIAGETGMVLFITTRFKCIHANH
jgi:aspartate-semialdehyde dehydrogenase